MQPVSGEVTEHNRKDIYIHGGNTPGSATLDEERELNHTKGCVRVHNNDINALVGTVDTLADRDHDPISNIFIGDAATINAQADEKDAKGNYRYPELRAAHFGTPDPPATQPGNEQQQR